MSISIFHSVNASLLLKCGDCGILIDGLHKGKEQGFSSFPEELLAPLHSQSGVFSQVNAALFTHLHPDHYDSALLDDFTCVQSSATIWGPYLPSANCTAISLSPGVQSLPLFPDNIEVLAIRTIHDGAAFQNTPHVSFLIRYEDTSVLIAGDALLTSDDVQTISSLLSGQLDAAFFIPYQFITATRANAVEELNPKKVFLYHLPFPEDDGCSTYRLADRAITHSKKTNSLNCDYPTHVMVVHLIRLFLSSVAILLQRYFSL